jgi:O-antigen ligase
MVVFSPWAFGTTQPWSISLMNGGGYALGILLGAKWIIRRVWGWQPERWSHCGEEGGSERVDWITRGLAGLTVAILAYTLVSALNARATFLPADYQFEYHNCISWLPHSYDSVLTWKAFWRLLALACSFWAVRDWLLVKSRKDVCEREPDQSGREGRGVYFLPSRLRLLLWVVSLNGAILAVEGLLQHTLGDGRLLWLVTPRINKSPDAQFGPYAYRSNAAQYFLLAWPLTLAFWWVLRGKARRMSHRRTHQNLLPCIFLMAIVPLISLSRAGAIIGCGSLAVALVLLARVEYRSGRKKLPGMVVLLGLGIILAGLMEWQHLGKRFREVELDSGRRLIWWNSWGIVKDHPLFGTGPGTFDSVYQIYRPTIDSPWHAMAHNDWLEILLTFGIAGSALLVAALGLLLASPWRGGQGIPASRLFIHLLILALSNCLVYAVVDFPLQIYSVVFLFVLACSILSCLFRLAR